MKLHAKALYIGEKAGEGGQKLYTFRATTDVVDRQGEIVTLDGWDFGNYEKNPVVLDSHNYFGIENIVGRAVGPMRQVDGAWEADILFNNSPKGQLAQMLVDSGDLRAVSVGFASQERAIGAQRGDPLKHTKKELLEISVVPVPANAEALRVRSLGGDEDAAELLERAIAGIEAEVKAGRTLSAKNESLLRTASESLTQVLASLEKPQPEDEAGKTLDVDLSAAIAFVGRK